MIRCRAMFSLLKRTKSSSPPPDIALMLFDTLVKPVVLYGAEVWGCENCDTGNKMKLRFCKSILHKCTCSNMYIDIKCKIVRARLITSKENKLCKIIYSPIYILSVHSTWISYVKNTLDSVGFTGICTNPSLLQVKFSS